MAINLTDIGTTGSDATWIAQRLPKFSDDCFSKNGITQSVASAIALALADNTTDGVTSKYLALADLLEILDSDYATYSQRAGTDAWAQPLLQKRIAYWRCRGDSGSEPGRFQSIPVVTGDDADYDEFAR